MKEKTKREQYGNLSSIIGIIVNVVLFAAKFAVGTIFNSVAIVADAINSITDAGSSVISLISFKLSAKPADEKHPFGYERVRIHCFFCGCGINSLVRCRTVKNIV